ncbi:unnamed protein product [Schistosoma curassoni]|uniref:Uncharacterized protein n=1 Tax=Schistosoma curassoni TaxID=6186 RepID=A0A183KRI0_9TREM|nr:unnamed protein product [Schistosoma curassoni]
MPCPLITTSYIHSHIWPNLIQMLFPTLWYDVVCLVGI